LSVRARLISNAWRRQTRSSCSPPVLVHPPAPFDSRI
jgi:hypothetical protein